MRHNRDYDKNVHWQKNFIKELELSAVNLQPSTDKNEMQNEKYMQEKAR